MTNLKIITVYDPPPIPDRSCDWTAYVDGREEYQWSRGRTEAEALADLMWQLEDEESN